MSLSGGIAGRTRVTPLKWTPSLLLHFLHLPKNLPNIQIDPFLIVIYVWIFLLEKDKILSVNPTIVQWTNLCILNEMTLFIAFTVRKTFLSPHHLSFSPILLLPILTIFFSKTRLTVGDEKKIFFCVSSCSFCLMHSINLNTSLKVLEITNYVSIEKKKVFLETKIKNLLILYLWVF